MKKFLLNLLFVLICGGILYFLLNAPEKSTTPLPFNDDHKQFFDMKKKEAEKYCLDCHGDGEIMPLAPEHPAKLRCLFCHTRDVPKQ